MQKYDSYKDSGVQWLGEIPSHWEVVPISSVASCNDDTWEETTPNNTLINYVEISDVSLSSGINNITRTCFGDAPSRARRRTKIGDIIVSTVRTYLQAVAPIDCEGLTVSTGFAVLRPKLVFPQFLLYYAVSSAFISDVIRNSKGTSYPAINASDLIRLKTLLPPLSEQTAIASYLDAVTAKIDKAIAQQQKMIALLNERKQIIINNAVTKGLDPDVKMKDSGVEWIGMVPEGWEVLPLKRCCSFVRDKSTSQMKYRVALENIESWSGKYIHTESEFDGIGIVFQKGDVLFGKLRPYLAKVFLADDCGEALGDFWVLRSNRLITPEYLQELLISKRVIDMINSTTYGTKMPRADWSENSKMILPIPPIQEQIVIASKLRNVNISFGKVIDNCNRQISLLRERKQIIINEVVTGKVKVC